jgi:hypothetical protein
MKYMDLLFVALMSHMQTAGAVLLMQAKRFRTVAQIAKVQPYSMRNAYLSMEMRISLAILIYMAWVFVPRII